jgi:hypothetical protein
MGRREDLFSFTLDSENRSVAAVKERASVKRRKRVSLNRLEGEDWTVEIES